jgi:NAD(P)-dependent dehydrogenase (short-subunit alcohol dehydrogenase family)
MNSQHKTAIVTGAGKRVGAEIAQALLDDRWSVLAHVRRDSDVVPEGAVRVAADFADGACADIVFAAAAGLPPVRLLVNNAARFAWDDLGAFDAQEFDSHMAVNARAPLLLMKAFAAAHDGTGDGLIINILDAKLAAPNPDFLSYTLSKQALAGASELAARALASKGIRVNAIAPSLMLRSPGQSDDNFTAMHMANPLRRGVEPTDVIAALRYLVAARSVTGQTLTIDGGQRFWSLERDVQFLSPSGDGQFLEKQ